MKSIVLLLVAVSLLIPFQAGQTPGNKKESPAAKSPPPITTVNNNYEASKKPDKAEDNPHWYSALKKPEWWLVLAAALTLLAIAYQATEMKRATHEMRESTRAVKAQVGLMERQTKAIEDTAQSANDNIELIIKKERATLAFELSDVEWKDAPIPPFNSWLGDVQCKILFFGYTPAYVSDSSTWAFINGSKEPPTETTRSPIDIPKIISSDTELPVQRISIWPIFFEPEDTEAVRKNLSFIHFHGYVRYEDQFGRPHETTIKCRWEEPGIPGLQGQWINYGRPEDNQQT